MIAVVVPMIVAGHEMSRSQRTNSISAVCPCLSWQVVMKAKKRDVASFVPPFPLTRWGEDGSEVLRDMGLFAEIIVG